MNVSFDVIIAGAGPAGIDEDVVADLENGPTIESIVLTENGDE